MKKITRERFESASIDARKTSEQIFHTPQMQGLLTVSQFCEKYNVRRTKFYELVKSGALKAKSIDGSMTRIRPIDAECWASELDQWATCKQQKPLT